MRKNGDPNNRSIKATNRVILVSEPTPTSTTSLVDIFFCVSKCAKNDDFISLIVQADLVSTPSVRTR